MSGIICLISILNSFSRQKTTSQHQNNTWCTRYRVNETHITL